MPFFHEAILGANPNVKQIQCGVGINAFKWQGAQ
jgi:hypothetical protein